MDKWIQLSQAVYYTGVGAVLLGTTIRFLFRFFKKKDAAFDFIQEVQTVHLSNIYGALEQIANRLHIQLEYKTPGPRPL